MILNHVFGQLYNWILYNRESRRTKGVSILDRIPEGRNMSAIEDEQVFYQNYKNLSQLDMF